MNLPSLLLLAVAVLFWSRVPLLRARLTGQVVLR